MIENTFCHIKGVGGKIEKLLWDSKIYNWTSFLTTTETPLTKKKYETIQSALEQSSIALQNYNHKYFSENLPINQHWRLFRNFKNEIAYLDIETTGLAPTYDVITTIALYDGKNIKYYINGENLDQFKTDIKNYKLLVTYNGKCFDIPFIEGFFKIRLDHSHIDLRYLLHSLGYKGGLKGCEKQFGLSRNDLDGVDGFFAVLLWDEYKKTNNKRALETLLSYNIEDVVNLEYLMYSAYNLKIKQTPFADIQYLDIPQRPQIPFLPDKILIEKIKEKMFGSLTMTFSI